MKDSNLESRISRFLERHFGPPRLFFIVALWALLLGVWGSLARTVLPIEHRPRWEVPIEQRAPLYAKFDSGWYLSIIEGGYGAAPPEGRSSSHAFFPLYPATAKVLHDTFALDGFHAGLLVTYLCLFLAMPLFLREGRELLGERDAWSAVAFFLLFPASFFLTAVYAESMFLLFCLLAFRDARSGPLWRAALWGCLLGLTRASALAVAPALFLAALERGKARASFPPLPPAKRGPSSAPAATGASEKEGKKIPSVRPWGRAILLGAVPVVTVLLWIAGMGIAKGEPGLFFRAMDGWHRPSSSLAGFSGWFLSMKVRFVDADWKEDPTLALDYGAALLFAAIGVYQLVRRRWSDAAWTGAAIALPVTTGLSGGMPRFLMVVYPVYYALSEGSRGKPVARLAWWLVSGLVLLAAAARFVNWHWVA